MCVRIHLLFLLHWLLRWAVRLLLPTSCWILNNKEHNIGHFQSQACCSVMSYKCERNSLIKHCVMKIDCSLVNKIKQVIFVGSYLWQLNQTWVSKKVILEILWRILNVPGKKKCPWSFMYNILNFAKRYHFWNLEVLGIFHDIAEMESCLPSGIGHIEGFRSWLKQTMPHDFLFQCLFNLEMETCNLSVSQALAE